MKYFIEARSGLPYTQNWNLPAAERRRNMGSFAGRHGNHDAGVSRSGITRREALALTAFGLVAAPGSAFAADPEGQLTWGVHISLAPIWFDPADISGIITPFMLLYALHDA